MDTIDAVIATHAAHQPTAVAIVDGERTLSYADLDAKAHAFAERLSVLGIGSESIVAVRVPRSLELVVAFLGVIKAGAAYLPIDHDAPLERVQWMLEDSRAAATITRDGDELAIESRDRPRAPRVRSPRGLAYVIYTSGSTGRPKGTGIEHCTLLQLTKWSRQAFEVDASRRCAQFSNVAFDAHVWELWTALSAGAAVHLVPESLRADPDRFAEWIVRSKIHWAFAPTALADALVRRKWPDCALRFLAVGGEALGALPNELPPFALVNCYGPTECTVVSTAGPVAPGASRPDIGTAIDGARTYVLDDDLAPVADGADGELCIGGEIVGRGYLGRPALTADRFVPDPFSARPGARMYRTGDVVRRLPSGKLEFRGRRDHQVKIRGHRIELGEIETTLVGHPAVRDAVVLAVDDGQDRRLVAWAIAKGTDAAALREHCARSLPPYMVPSAFVLLDAFPLNANGKVDRKALPVPARTERAHGEAPLPGLESDVARAFAASLDLESVFANDDFLELGGHSLRAGRLVANLRRACGIDLPIRAVFEARTPRALARIASNAPRSDGATIPGATALERAKVSGREARLWLSEQLEPDAVAYNEIVALHVKGRIDPEVLARSLRRLEERHEALRTAYVDREGSPTRVVRPARDVVPLRTLEARDLDDALEAIRSDARRPYRFAEGHLWRASLVRLGDASIIAMAMHHIVTDGWSMNVLVRELSALYGGTELAPRPVDYADVVAWELANEHGVDEDVAHFARRLADVEDVELAGDRPRPARRRFRGERVPLHIAPDVDERVAALARAEGTTPSMVVFAALATLIHRHTGTPRFAIALPLANRHSDESENVVGFFVETVAIDFDFTKRPTFRAVVRWTRDAVLEAHAHARAPYEKVVDAVRRSRDPSRPALCQIAFAPQPPDATVSAFASHRAEELDVDLHVAKFELSLYAVERERSFQGAFELDADVFDRATGVAWAERFGVLLDAATSRPDELTARLRLMAEAERARVVDAWNATARPFRRDLTLHDALAERAAALPEAIAVADATRALTFAELVSEASSIERELVSAGVGTEGVVALVLPRSVDFVVAALAVMRAGGAYCAIDVDAPADRVSYTLEDSRAIAVITRDAGKLAVRRIREAHGAPKVRGRTTASTLAYVVYTSGSTGRPKGSGITHANALALVEAYRLLLDYAHEARFSQFANVAFDAHVFEIWTALAVGASVHIAPDEVRADAEEYGRWLERERISIASAATVLTEGLLARPWTPGAMRYLVVGGDALGSVLASPPFDLMNAYGPSECTVAATVGRVSPGTSKPDIGAPLANVTTYVLDAEGEPLPVGVPGELHIGGELVGRGYLHRPGLTADRFVPDPFSTKPGARMYRTGDIVRWLPNGRLDFRGRRDHQVKIRGYRIELDEIQTVLDTHPAVRSAIVVAREGAGGKRLVAYWVGAASSEELRAHCARQLPGYMVPSAFVSLKELPLNANGKVDRKALPEPELDPQTEYVAPRTALEEQLCTIFAEVLGVPRIGIHDDFFALGGHSLLAMRLAARLRHSLGREVSVRAIFAAPTVARLAAELERTEAATSALAIPRAARDGAIAPSFAQERLWFLEQLDPGQPTYHVPLALRAHGPVDAGAIERAIAHVVARHEALRTTFVSEDGLPRAIIHPAVHVPLVRGDHTPEAIRALIRMPFDLARGPLVRAAVLDDPNEHPLLVLVIHHIVTDGVSMEILARDLAAAIAASTRGDAPELPELAVQYADYAAWQRARVERGELERQVEVWRRMLEGAPPWLELPLDFPRPPRKGSAGSVLRFEIDDALARGVRKLAQEKGATPFIVTLSAFAVLLARHAGQDDVVIGTPIAGRTTPEVEGLIGLFVNTLALRVRLDRNTTFEELIGRARETALLAYENQEVPFDRVVEAVAPPRAPNRSPVFSVMFAYDSLSFSQVALPGFVPVPVEQELEISKFELTFSIQETERGLSGSFEWDTDLFARATIERCAQRFVALLRDALARPQARVHDLDVVAPADRALLDEWQAPVPVEPVVASAHSLFEVLARRSPNAIALEERARKATFAEVNARANRMARGLRARGVRRGDHVALHLPRSLDAIVAILAVLKAGAAYMPIDPALPERRKTRMISGVDARVVLHVDAPPRLAEIELALDREEDWHDDDDTDLALPAHPDDALVTLHTSGTTGEPKPVLLSHRGLVGYARAAAADWRVTADDRLLQFATLSFDVSVEEILVSWTTGAALVIRTEEMLDPEVLVASCEAERISVLDVPVAYLPLLTQAVVRRDGVWPPSLRLVCVGGERLQPAWTESFFAIPGAPRLTSLYGPTEASISVTTLDASPSIESDAPLGRPVVGCRVYVLDASLAPVPVGVIGEICVGGSSLARGYLGAPAATADRFVPDPFSNGGRLYRTGDLGRLRADGVLEFVGRKDGQVKVRGFRVELGEIEAALLTHPGVSEAAVLARDDKARTKQLVAYLVGSATPDELRAHVSELLPAYMIPVVFVPLERMPLNASGKIDRRALPEPDLSARRGELVLPRTPLEERIAAAFCEVLGIARVGIDDDFFALGGHSLLATQLASRLREVLALEIPVRTIFEAPTVARLAERLAEQIAHATRSELRAIERVARTGPLEASFTQERLWFLEQLDPGQATYHVPLVFDLRGPIDRSALEKSVLTLCARHESLRTTFVDTGGRPRQVIHPNVSLELEVRDVSQRSVDDALHELVHRPFSLTDGPLVRASLLRTSDTTSVFVLVIHHIVTDGVSTQVLIRELAALYAAFVEGREAALPELAIDYADYAAWQRRWLEDTSYAKSLSYWKEQLAGAPGALELPTDKPRPALKRHRGARLDLEIGADVMRAVTELARSEGATTFIVLLAAFDVLLSRHTGAHDIVVGTPIANRTRRDVEPLVGFFANTLALRTKLDGAPSFREVIARVKQTALEAYEHQDVPFERLVQELKVARDTSRTPVFQVMFTHERDDGSELSLAGVSATPRAIRFDTAKFDLSLGVVERNGALFGELEWDTDLFEKGTVARIAQRFEALLRDALARPDVPVGGLALMTDDERRRVLVEWNHTATDLAERRCVHELFEAQAQSSPHAIAVEYEDVHLTYRELDERANRLAHQLIRRGVTPGRIVAVCMHRSLEMVIALYGVLKAGAAYAPLDPTHPPARLELVAKDLEADFILVTRSTAPSVEAFCEAVVVDAAARDDFPEAKPDVALHDEQAAYVIYTSGSTGKPKGVMNVHGGLRNRLLWAQATLRLGPGDAVLQKTPYTFDVSVWELFAPFMVGARLVMARPDGHKDPQYLADTIRAREITTVHFVPSMLTAFLEGYERGSTPSLRRVLCSGEALTPAQRDRFFALVGCELHNLYGPTEASIDVSHWQCTANDDGDVPIGRPMWNTGLYVVDRSFAPCPIGVPGELCISGRNLARGYWRRPDLTADKFVPDPFAAEPGARMYRTGDLARWRRDGVIEYLGRIDHQVKLRGLRIELGEIEAALGAAKDVREAVVVMKERDGDKRLVAYVVPTPRSTPSIDAWRKEIARTLPEYMVPGAFVVLDAMPLTTSGKVDRKALPDPELESTNEYVAPRTPVEEKLCAIFAEILGVPRVGIHDDFFALGGHSLLATRLAARLRSDLAVGVTVRSVFDAPTVAKLAEVVESLRSGTREGTELAAPPIAPGSGGPVSSISQEGVAAWERKRAPSTVLVIEASIALSGRVDLALLHRAVLAQLARHGALRTRIDVHSTPMRIEGAEATELDVSVHDVSERPDAEAAALAIVDSAYAPFALAGEIPVRVRIIGIRSDHARVIIVTHHVAADNPSAAMFLRDVALQYAADLDGRDDASRAPLPITFWDFARWERAWLEGGGATRVERARRRFRDAAPLVLPSDRPNAGGLSTEASEAQLVFGADLVERIRQVCRDQNATPGMLFLVAAGAIGRALTGQTRIPIGAPTQVRSRHSELSNVVGRFLNVTAYLVDVDGDPSISELLARIRPMALESIELGDVPGQLVLGDESPLDCPLNRLMLNGPNFLDEAPPIVSREDLVVVDDAEPRKEGARNELTLAAWATPAELRIAARAARSHWDQSSMDRVVKIFADVLEACTREGRLSDLVRLCR